MQVLTRVLDVGSQAVQIQKLNKLLSYYIPSFGLDPTENKLEVTLGEKLYSCELSLSKWIFVDKSNPTSIYSPFIKLEYIGSYPNDCIGLYASGLVVCSSGEAFEYNKLSLPIMLARLECALKAFMSRISDPKIAAHNLRVLNQFFCTAQQFY